MVVDVSKFGLSNPKTNTSQERWDHSALSLNVCLGIVKCRYVLLNYADVYPSSAFLFGCL